MVEEPEKSQQEILVPDLRHALSPREQVEHKVRLVAVLASGGDARPARWYRDRFFVEK